MAERARSERQSRGTAPSPRRAAKSLVTSPGGPDSGRRTRGTDRARQIMEVAERMFYERGYAETSIDDIADAVGLLKGSLYYYMNSKEDLLYRIIDDVHNIVQAKLDDACDRADLPAFERLLMFVTDQVGYNARHVPQIAVYHHEWLRLEGDRLSEIRQRRRQQELTVIGLLEEAKREKTAPSALDTKLGAASVFAVIIWPYTWYRPGSITPAELASFCAGFIKNGLGLA